MFEFIIYPPKSAILGYVFNYPVRVYGVIMAFVFFLGILVSYFLFKKRYSNQVADMFLDYSPVIIFLSVIGARLFYILGSLDFYLANPAEIILINHGGLSIYGAIFFGLATLFILSRKKKFSFFSHCDIIATVFPLCQSIGRYGNYFNQEAFGKPTELPLKLYVDEIYRPIEFQDNPFYHPTFLYESMLDFIIFIILLVIFIKKPTLKSGLISCFYLILYSTTRFFIEEIRIDSVLSVFNLPIAQVISILIFICSIFGLILILSNKKATHK